MSLESDYVPSPEGWVRTDVERIEAAGDTGVVHRQGRPVVLVTMRGAKSGALRKVPLMRVEHEGELVIVASQGGAPEHPKWYWNLRANPDVEVQDGRRDVPGPGARARRQGAVRLVGAGCRGVSPLCGVPGPHPAAHPAVPAGASLTP